MSVITIKHEADSEKILKILQTEDSVHSFGKSLNSKDFCLVCSGPRSISEERMIVPLVGHHVRYFPPLIAWVHYECHKKIHDTKNPIKSLIQYPPGDARKYYEKKQKGSNLR